MPDAGSAFTALKPRVYIAPHRHTSHDARSRDLREIVVFPRDCGVSLYLICISRKCLSVECIARVTTFSRFPRRGTL